MKTVLLDESKPHVHATCPCGGTYTAGEFSVDGAESQPGATHSVPECPKFGHWSVLNGADARRHVTVVRGVASLSA